MFLAVRAGAAVSGVRVIPLGGGGLHNVSLCKADWSEAKGVPESGVWQAPKGSKAVERKRSVRGTGERQATVLKVNDFMMIYLSLK